MKYVLILAASVFAASMPLAPQAKALDFNFSFSNVTEDVSGTVTGVIKGLTDNATSAASDITITFAPAGVTPLPATTFSIFDYATQLNSLWGSPYIVVNNFTVTNGVITDALFQIYGGYFDINVAGQYNSLHSSDKAPAGTEGHGLGNQDGLGGITFTEVPEPASWMLISAGLLGLGATRRRVG